MACRKHGISAATRYGWNSEYAGVSESDLTGMGELEIGNARLKRMYADLALGSAAMKGVIARKYWCRQPSSWRRRI